MIRGETVTVRLRIFGDKDVYGNEEETFSEPSEVENVLVGRGSTVNTERDGQPYAIRADRLFCFPKGYTADLRGALITRDGKTYQVIGEPVDFTEENMPSHIPWNMKAEAVRYDG